jgi:PAS domain S-box-containing protein
MQIPNAASVRRILAGLPGTRRLRSLALRQRAAEAKLQALVERAPLAIVTLDGEGLVTSWSPGAERLFGWREAEVAGRKPRIAPEGSGVFDDFVELASRGQSFVAVELPAVRRGGTQLDISASTVPVTDELGAPAGVMLIMANVTERRRAQQALHENERRFRALVQHGTDIITIADATGSLQYVSPAVERVLGYREVDLLGQPILDFVHPEDRRVAEDALRNVIERPGEHRALAVRIRARDGSWHEFETMANNLLEEPAIRGIVYLARDVTERNRLEAQLRQAQKLESIGRLAGGVAHDFNNLMTAIIGDAELNLAEAEPGSPLALDLEEIRDTARRASNLAHQLLAFSRRETVRPSVVGLEDVLIAAEPMLRRLVGEEADLEVRTAANAGHVTVDPVQFEQVLTNLVVNARDAMAGSGGCVLVEAFGTHVAAANGRQHPGVPAGDYGVLRVTDTGKGIPAEVREHLFEPFYTTKPVGRGSGLGLATCYGIVKQAGGEIVVESEVGRGSAFSVYLPQAAEVAGNPFIRSEDATLPRGDETILLVEDEPSVRSIGARTLRGLGYTVLEARDGEEGLRVGGERTEEIDLVVTDVVMPRMSGKELADRLRERGGDLRVLFTSGYMDSPVVRSSLSQPDVEFLPKPFSPRALAHKVRQTLDRLPARGSR